MLHLPRVLSRILYIVSLLTLLCGTSSVLAQGTAFTYQGRLVYAGNSANGNYDLTFQLWDSATNGNALSAVVTNLDLPITNGLFVVQLDFGPSFPGQARYLEIGTRNSGDTNPPAILSPRQLLTPSPYAITAAGLAGSVPDSQLSTNVALLNGNPVFLGGVTASGFSGSGTGLTSLTASNLTGTVPNSALPADVALTDAPAQTFSGSNVFAGGVSAVSGGVNYYMVPEGAIILWSGSVSNIPAGWALCNGNNGTPNLLDKFVVAAGNTYSVGAVGGATTHTHSVPGLSIPGLSVPGLSIPGLSVPGLGGGTLAFDRNVNVIGGGNTTGGTLYFNLSSGNSTSGNMTPLSWGGTTATGTTGTGTTGTGATGTGTTGAGTSGSASSLPPYYALCYIMKL
jgi:hypothetical protein